MSTTCKRGTELTTRARNRFGDYLARGPTSAADYYVGGRNLPWWAVGISTMATQSSAISFISIPAFVAGKAGPASEEELGRGPFRATIPITSLTERKNSR